MIPCVYSHKQEQHLRCSTFKMELFDCLILRFHFAIFHYPHSIPSSLLLLHGSTELELATDGSLVGCLHDEFN